ncbi:2-oxo acid dehydrogenase subunit E2 [Myxococcota bacterium]|nr:2-oxo acid dehydrogenase subunit E2 [Myxococcota bacterium]
MYSFKLPDLGEGIHEGEILKWHVAAGDRIEVDAPLIEVETDKAAVTIPSPVGGVVTAINGAVGDVILVGAVLVTIEDGQATPPIAVEAPRPLEAPRSLEAPVTPARLGPVPAAPATRRLARALGVDLQAVPPSGPAGRVTRQDVERFAAAPTGPELTRPELTPPELTRSEPVGRAEAPTPSGPAATIPFYHLPPMPDFAQLGPITREPMRSIRRKTAQRMVTAMTVVPHVAHMDEADVTELERLRKAPPRRGEEAGGLTLLPFIIKAVSAGLRDFPQFNASVDPIKEEIIYKQYINIGFAVDTPRGLVVPVIRGCQGKSIRDVADEALTLGEAARRGALAPHHLQGGCFSVTNVGAIGGTGVIPTINYPEVAILGMGRVQEKPVVRHGEIVIRRMLPLTLAFDHRVADGAAAARFMTQLVRRLSDPYALLLEI